MSAAPAQPRGGCHWAYLSGTGVKHHSNLLTTTKKTRQAPPRPLQQLPLYPRQQVPPLGESSLRRIVLRYMRKRVSFPAVATRVTAGAILQEIQRRSADLSINVTSRNVFFGSARDSRAKPFAVTNQIGWKN